MSVQGLIGVCKGDAVSVQGACKECRTSVQGGQDECARVEWSVRGRRECKGRARGSEGVCKDMMSVQGLRGVCEGDAVSV